MKKIFALLLIWILLFSVAAAENGSYEIELKLAGERETVVHIRMLEENGSSALISSDLTDPLSFRFDRSLFTLSENLLLLQSTMHDPVCLQVFTDSWDEWIAEQRTTVHKGTFTGNLFDFADEETETVFSLSDFLMLNRMILQNLNNTSALSAQQSEDIARSVNAIGQIISGYAIRNNIRFIMRSYLDRKYISVSVLQKGETVMTISVDRHEPGQTLILIGHAENEKDYYQRIRLVHGEENLQILSELLADNSGQGPEELSDSDLIIRTSWNIVPAGDDNAWTFETEVRKDDDSKIFVSKGTLQKNEEGYTLTAESSADESGNKLHLDFAKKYEGSVEISSDHVIKLSDGTESPDSIDTRIRDLLETQFPIFSLFF